MQLSVMKTSSIAVMTLFFLFGVVVSTEDYIDYTADENANRDLEDLYQFYKILFRRSTIDDNGLSNLRGTDTFGFQDDHLMIRKAQRAPSLRLRFGRSQPWTLLRHARSWPLKPLRFNSGTVPETPIFLHSGQTGAAAMPEGTTLD